MVTQHMMSVVIPTCDTGPNLSRTLKSLRDCELPSNLRQVVVVENGGGQNLAKLVENFEYPFEMKYINIPEGNKNLALNTGLSECDQDFVVFFDDDIRLHPQCLKEYSRISRENNNGVFVAGNCGVDYELHPPQWMLEYLPASAVGWSKGINECELDGPEALGFNWGAFTEDIAKAGWFDESIGPGTILSIGDESEMQMRLLQLGVKGIYLPKAKVWHWVPQDKCSTEWALRRAKVHATYKGVQLRTSAETGLLAIKCTSILKILICATVLRWLSRFASEKLEFVNRRKVFWHQGILDGLKLDLPHQTPKGLLRYSTNIPKTDSTL